jgi:hypothetical protein
VTALLEGEGDDDIDDLTQYAFSRARFEAGATVSVEVGNARSEMISCVTAGKCS